MAARAAGAAMVGVALGAMAAGAEGAATGLRTSAGLSTPPLVVAGGPTPDRPLLSSERAVLQSAPLLQWTTYEPGTGSMAEVAVDAVGPAVDRDGDGDGARSGERGEPDGGSLVATATGAEVVARAAPGPDEAEVARFTNPIASGAPLVFLVVGRSGDWLEVSLPIRPNGSTGWIPADTVTVSRNRFRIEVDVSDHRLVVFEWGRPVIDTEIGIGTGATPTPIGAFYLVELLAPSDPDGFYGPYAFGLSGYSETLSSYNGGVGVIGIHGTNDPSSLGRDASNGCVRVDNDVITRMADFLPLGTTVEIRP